MHFIKTHCANGFIMVRLFSMTMLFCMSSEYNMEVPVEYADETIIASRKDNLYLFLKTIDLLALPSIFNFL